MKGKVAKNSEGERNRMRPTTTPNSLTCSLTPLSPSQLTATDDHYYSILVIIITNKRILMKRERSPVDFILRFSQAYCLQGSVDDNNTEGVFWRTGRESGNERKIWIEVSEKWGREGEGMCCVRYFSNEIEKRRAAKRCTTLEFDTDRQKYTSQGWGRWKGNERDDDMERNRIFHA